MPTISVVMIVKNEEVMLGRCLDSVKGADEIIICDTGSTDRTIEIAKKYTDKVFTDFVWCDDFAKARNHAKSKATCDWIFSIDADEYCHDFSKVREAVNFGFMAINCKLIADDNRQENVFPRLFKNSPAVEWVGAIHNYPNIIGENVGDVTITYTYSPAHFTDKDRTIRILEREVKEHGGQREMFYLGREYFYRAQYDKAVVILGQYVQRSRYLAEKAEAFLIMSKSYWMSKMPDDARDACVQALIINANFREASLWMAMLAGEGSGNARWEANARQWNHMAATATNDDVLFVRK